MTRKIPAARIALCASFAVLALVLVPVSLAAKGGGGGAGKPSGGGGGTTGGSGGTLALVFLDSTDGLAHWGQRITYTVSTTATYPYVSTTCYQGSTLVLSTSAGFFPSYPWQSAQIVPLTTMLWTGGAADCSAKLYLNGSRGETTLATLSFHAYA